MKFRLIYNGDVLSSHAKKDHKHAIRKTFHVQIKRLLDVRVHKSVKDAEPATLGFSSIYNFVPMVWKLKHPPECSLDILLLQRHSPGKPIHAGDIDNRLKTIVDALRIPSERQELPDSATPEPDEDPFFCLLEDDRLITHLSVETDQWFEPTKDGGARSLYRKALVETEGGDKGANSRRWCPNSTVESLERARISSIRQSRWEFFARKSFAVHTPSPNEALVIIRVSIEPGILTKDGGLHL